jgi:Tfp pilus assembly protein PilX
MQRPPPSRAIRPPLRIRGAALLMSLLIVLALLIIGVSAARTALHAERAARAERDRHIALQAAEAALADAERDIEGGSDPASPRAALFAPDNAIGFDPGCGHARAVNHGLCAHDGAATIPAWQGANLAGADTDGAISVAYGRYTAARLPIGQGGLPARLPRYLIELMPFARAGEDAGQRRGNFYRITAIGFGTRDTTQVVLQTFYLKPARQAS